jgi:hypothetical protein
MAIAPPPTYGPRPSGEPHEPGGRDDSLAHWTKRLATSLVAQLSKEPGAIQSKSLASTSGATLEVLEQAREIRAKLVEPGV